MMLAAFLLLVAQDVPAPASAVADEEEIVVTATFGRTTMLFDKGADGKLRNCRIMVSSGSQRRDVAACQATPVCYAGTRDEVSDCIDLVVLPTASPVAAPGPATGNGPVVFEIPRLVPPKPSLSANLVGPSALGEESRETERQRVKLPPLPKADNGGPVIRITNAQDQ